ncbi:protein CREG1 [Zeugodacus cucurbitae]|uniref:protein CREG1 n=1 Tax=Zeugodacus cucurbitae TaxID=28588 RepID=UPI0023D8E277|nr:protein CREG1 [Zeugodacus cucurbitae]XP_054088469.1 protein CREG1 [Zeugodacus cucurbitae]
MAKAITSVFTFALVTLISLNYCAAYSALEDARIIAEYKRYLRTTNHAAVARTLVHKTNWASVGSISTNDKITDYPMVNIISVDDSALDGSSTGRIHFLLTDLDFTGPDWKHVNKVTFLFSDDQTLNCKNHGQDPMEPTCARTIISGKVKELDKKDKDYNDWLQAFTVRHPAAKKWIKAHSFYLCELEIENIFVLDFYGGPHNIAVKDYYNAKPN